MILLRKNNHHIRRLRPKAIARMPIAIEELSTYNQTNNFRLLNVEWVNGLMNGASFLHCCPGKIILDKNQRFLSRNNAP